MWKLLQILSSFHKNVVYNYWYVYDIQISHILYTLSTPITGLNLIIFLSIFQSVVILYWMYSLAYMILLYIIFRAIWIFRRNWVKSKHQLLILWRIPEKLINIPLSRNIVSSEQQSKIWFQRNTQTKSVLTKWKQLHIFTDKFVSTLYIS